jgi:hypothetical protein
MYNRKICLKNYKEQKKMRGTGFEPANPYETSPSTMRNVWRYLYYGIAQ